MVSRTARNVPTDFASFAVPCGRFALAPYAAVISAIPATSAITLDSRIHPCLVMQYLPSDGPANGTEILPRGIFAETRPRNTCDAIVAAWLGIWGLPRVV